MCKAGAWHPLDSKYCFFFIWVSSCNMSYFLLINPTTSWSGLKLLQIEYTSTFKGMSTLEWAVLHLGSSSDTILLKATGWTISPLALRLEHNVFHMFHTTADIIMLYICTLRHWRSSTFASCTYKTWIHRDIVHTAHTSRIYFSTAPFLLIFLPPISRGISSHVSDLALLSTLLSSNHSKI